MIFGLTQPKAPDKVDVAVVGGGPAGLAAALYLARFGTNVAVFEREIFGGKLRWVGTVENYLGFPEGVEGAELAERMQKQAKKAGAKLIPLEVERIVKAEESFLIKTPAGETEALSCIIATGSSPRRLGVEGEDRLFGKGVSYCAVCDAPLFREKTVAVVGGGNTALSYTQVLSSVASKVFLIHRRGAFRAEKALVDKVKSLPNVEFVLEAVVSKILGDEKVEAVEVTKKGESERLQVDGVFISVGFVPSVPKIEPMPETDGKGFVIVDEHMQTSVEGLFAIGDVRAGSPMQIATAVADGVVSAKRSFAIISGRRGGSV